MKLPRLEVDTTHFIKLEHDVLRSGDPTPVAQVFAFHLFQLMDAAGAMSPDDLSLHEFLMELSIEGLWQMRAKQRVFVGYIPGTEKVPVVRLFLMARREPPFGNFMLAASKRPGYIETGRDFIRGGQTEPLAYWEYPCSAYALWTPSLEGVPFLNSELSGFDSGGNRYWMIHREIDLVGPDVYAL
jgi:hypothetical protein